MSLWTHLQDKEDINLKKKAAEIKTILVMAGFGIIAFVCLMIAANKLTGRYDKAEVIAAIKRLPVNTMITESNVNEYFTKVMTDKRLAGDSIITDEQDLIGMYNTEVIRENENISKDVLSRTKDIKEGYREPVEGSFKVNNFADALSGRIRGGDYVYVYVTDKSTGVTTKASEEPIYIEAVFDGNGAAIENSDETTTAISFNFLIEKGMEQAFYEAVANGEVIAVKADKSDRDNR